MQLPTRPEQSALGIERRPIVIRSEFMILFTPIDPNPFFRRIYKALGSHRPQVMGHFTPSGQEPTDRWMAIFYYDYNML
jgi:hypothetical protein